MKKLITILFFLISLFTFSQNKYYVSSSTGNDGDSGLTEGLAWATLDYAEANATTAGDTIALRKGDVFQRASILQITHSGTSANPIVWDGSLWGVIGDTATIQATATTGGANVRFVTCHDVTFQNIIVDGDSMAKRGVVIGGSSGFYGSPDQYDEHDIIVQNCEIKAIGSTTSGWQPGVLVRCVTDTINNITIKNNHIHHTAAHGLCVYAERTYLPWTGTYDALSKNIYIGYNTIDNVRVYTSNTGNGIMLTRQCDSITVEYNTIITNRGDALLDIGSWHEYGYLLKTDHIIIRYNYFESNTVSSLPVIMTEPSDSLTYAIHIQIYGNIIYANNTGSKGIHFDMSGVASSYAGSVIEIYNNTIISNANSTFQDDIDADFTIRNNVFFNDVTTGGLAFVKNGGSGIVTHSNNLYYVSSTGNWVNDNGSYYTQSTISTGFETTAQTTDPAFVTDFTDLHLQSGSPAIGKGVAISGVTTDYDGVTYADPTRAIGALEYVSSSPTTVTGFAKHNGHYIKQNGHFVKH